MQMTRPTWNATFETLSKIDLSGGNDCKQAIAGLRETHLIADHYISLVCLKGLYYGKKPIYHFTMDNRHSKIADLSRYTIKACLFGDNMEAM